MMIVGMAAVALMVEVGVEVLGVSGWIMVVGITAEV